MIDLPYKQERFAQGVVKGLTQADAYRAAYRTQNMKADTIHQSASRLMADRKVAARLAELRQPVAERVDMSIHAHVSRLAQIRDAAMQAGDHGPATRAEIAIGQVAGHYVQKIEVNSSPFSHLTLQEKIDLQERVTGMLKKSEALPAPDVQDVEVKGAPPT
jgi:hypothetical protein